MEALPGDGGDLDEGAAQGGSRPDQPGTHSPAAWPKKRQGSREWSSMSKKRVMAS